MYAREVDRDGELVAMAVMSTITGPALGRVARAIDGQMGSSRIALVSQSWPTGDDLASRRGRPS